MSLPVVLRVKKRKLPPSAGAAIGTAEAPDAADAAVRLLLAPVDAPAKRPRVAAAGESSCAGGGIFVFAGRVASAEAALAEAAVRRAIGKRKLDDEAERLRRRLGERPSEGEGRLVYKRRRRVDPTPVRPLATAAAAASASATADAAECRFRIVDFEAATGPTMPRAPGEEPIACNGVAMTANVDEDVYYDVYYGYCDGEVGGLGDCGSRQQQLHYILQAYEEAYRYGDDGDAGPGGFAIEDAGSDSDSNSESNWRNDYPDTPEGSSEDGGGGGGESDDDADDMDPYDDHDSHDFVGGLSSRLRSACIADAPSEGDSDDDDGGGDDAAAELRDWRSFKRQLLLGSQQEQQQTTDNK